MKWRDITEHPESQDDFVTSARFRVFKDCGRWHFTEAEWFNGTWTIYNDSFVSETTECALDDVFRQTYWHEVPTFRAKSPAVHVEWLDEE